MKKVIIILIFSLFLGNLVSQTYSPVSVTGFNIDAVAETFPNSLATTTQALDQVVAGGNSVMYSVGFATSAGFTGGLPNNGTIINGSKTFQLEPFTGNNALFAPSASSNTLTLTTPASYSSISLLVFSTEGSSTLNVTFNFTDLTSTNAGNFTVLDWFGGANAVISGIGRCKRVTSGPTYDGVPSNPRLYAIDIPLTCTNQQKMLSSITINGITSNVFGGGGYALAVSGIAYNPALPSINYSSNSFCQLGANTTPTITGTNGGTFTSSPSGLNMNASTGEINFPSSAVNTYSITYTTSGACPTSGTYTLSVVSNPTLVVNSPTVCPGANTVLFAMPSTMGGTFHWLQAGQTTQSITVSPIVTTTYSVEYNLNGCIGTATANVVINNALTLSVNSDTVCAGQMAILTASPTPLGGTFVWSPTAQTNQSVSVSPIVTTPYTVVYSVNGCTVQATTTVTVKSTPTVTVNSPFICSGETATLTANAIPIGGNFIWLPSAQTTSIITDSPTSTTNYTLSYSLNGCSTTLNAPIVVNPNPTLTLVSSANHIAPLDNISLTATGGNTYLWNTGETSSNISVSPAKTTTYCAIATSVAGCTSANCIEITVTGESTLYLPNVFTPNGDGVNDLFVTPNFNMAQYTLLIFNRWGEKMFETNDALKGWDGSYNGKNAPSGVYVYTLQAKGFDDVDYKKSGHITLIR